MMNILVIGPSAVEHCITDILNKSPSINKIYLIKPNLAFANLGFKTKRILYKELFKEIKYLDIDFVFVHFNLFDIFNHNNIKVFGTPKEFAQLETSKKYGL